MTKYYTRWWLHMMECNETKHENIREFIELRVLEALYKNSNRKKNLFIFKFKEVNGELIYTFCDGELLYQLGFKQEEIIGREISEVNLLKNPNFVDYYLRAWNGRVVFFEDKKSQENMTTLFWLSRIKDKKQGHEVVGICFDISKKKRVEQLSCRKEKRDVVSRLAAGVAHEIRNPLTSIKGFLQLIEFKTTVDHQKYFNIIKSELDQIENVINGFLLLGQIENSCFRKHDVHKIVDDVISFLTPLAMKNNVKIKTRIDGYLPCIISDGNQLKRVFTHIIRNAIEAMPSGGEVCISIEQISEESIMIRCVDQGCGIEEERISKLSEPFYSIKEKGIGLGLMMSYKIIEAHNGHITIKSKVNLGTVVEITLPINPY